MKEPKFFIIKCTRSRIEWGVGKTKSSAVIDSSQWLSADAAAIHDKINRGLFDAIPVYKTPLPENLDDLSCHDLHKILEKEQTSLH